MVATTLIGFLGVVLRRNFLMKIISLDVMSTGVISFYVAIASQAGDSPPIVTAMAVSYAHPVPQAVIVTAIVIGFATLTLSLTYTMLVVKKTSTLDSRRVEERVNW
ncbi:MAG: Na+/H+ antiporter subunit C [Thermotogae bacterium]|nr:MAG: Na+/H+ antiporter subunit C [Thermotogota bacterium]